MHHTFKKNITIILFHSIILLPPFFTHAQTTPPSSVTINPTFNPNFISQPNIYLSSSNTQTALTNSVTNITTIKEQLGKIADDIHNAMTKENCEFATSTLTKFMWDHRYHIIGYTTIGAYAITSLLLFADYHYLQNNDCWSRWKPDCSFENLCEIPQSELAHELLITIGQRHYNKKNPTDFGHQLIGFVHTIETEIVRCKRYLSFAKTIQKLHMLIIFPTNEQKIVEVQHLLERALFIKHIFLSWLTDYSLTSTHRKNAHHSAKENPL